MVHKLPQNFTKHTRDDSPSLRFFGHPFGSPYYTSLLTRAMERKDPSEDVFLYIESDKTAPKLVKRSDLEWIDHPTLLFAETVVYPPDLHLDALPTRIQGLFYASSRLKGHARPSEPLAINVSLSKSWSNNIFGPVVFMQSCVDIDADKRVVSSDASTNVTRDTTVEELARLQSLFHFRSPGLHFLQTVRGVPSYNCPLRDYLRPFPLPTDNTIWKHAEWPLKKAVNELCTRIGVKANHVPATALEIDATVLDETQRRRMFWTKIDLTRENPGEVTEFLSGTYVASNGPFQKKADSENSACITFLSDYHDSYISQSDPDLYRRTRLLLGEAPVEDTEIKSEDSPVEASASDGLSSVPEDVKKPSMALWERYSLNSKIDLFGNGSILKSIVKRGSGLSLGVSCTTTAWIAVSTEGDNEMEVIYTSKFEEVTIGAIHEYLPIAALCSMRIGEAAYFLIAADLVCNHNLISASPTLESGAPMLIAVFIPAASNSTFANNYPIESNESSTMKQRVARCSRCSTDAVALYQSKQFKVALDYYQIGLKELSHKNLTCFKSGLSVLRGDIEWTPELDEFKACFIRNRLGAAACCLYIDHWPHFNDHWKLGSTAIEEGLLACDAVLSLERLHFVALRRKALLLIKSRDFEAASNVISLAEGAPEATSDAGKKDLENLKSERVRTKAKDSSDSESLARSIGKNLFA